MERARAGHVACQFRSRGRPAPLSSALASKACVSMEFRFPMPMTIRCYSCGKAFDVMIADRDSHDYPCPACGNIEVFDLGMWEKKAIAYNKKKFRKPGGGR